MSLSTRASTKQLKTPPSTLQEQTGLLQKLSREHHRYSYRWSDQLLSLYRQVVRVVDGFELKYRYAHWLHQPDQPSGTLYQLSCDCDLSELALLLASGAMPLQQLTHLASAIDLLYREDLYRARVLRLVQLDRLGDRPVRHLLVQVPHHELERLQQEEPPALDQQHKQGLIRYYEQLDRADRGGRYGARA
ncbi:MAG: hypothetical protein LWW87_07300 [Geobacteraceae bacterium]|nr:hypothetical protein [Geobacteraceae bacterium]